MAEHLEQKGGSEGTPLLQSPSQQPIGKSSVECWSLQNKTIFAFHTCSVRFQTTTRRVEAMMTSPAIPPRLSRLEIIRQHPRERLFVHPLFWTARQCALLDCHFQFDEANHVVLPDADTADSANPELLRSAKRLALVPDSLVKAQALVNLLARPGTGLQRSDRKYTGGVNLCFSERRVANIPCLVLVTSHAPDVLAPRVAFLDFGTPGARRALRLDQQVGARRCGHYNPPCKSLARRWLRRLTPQDPLQDPYIVALLIALAQAQRAAVRGKGANLDGDWPVWSLSNLSVRFLRRFTTLYRFEPANSSSIGLPHHDRKPKRLARSCLHCQCSRISTPQA